jgi:hypothetical protein
MKITTCVVAIGLSASVALADANVEQKTQFHISGAVGAIVNVFSRTAREGATSTTIIKGNRKLTRTGDSGEIIDLGEEKVYMVDFARRAYTVKTFADLRREFEEQRERARKEAEKQEKSGKAEKNEGPEYEVEFDVKSTGAKETINGFNTHEEVMTVTVHEKGKKLEQSGGWVLTSDMWVGPRVPAMREIVDFDLKFMQKVYGSAMADMRQVAMAMAATPAFGKAMKVMADKGKTLDGTAIRTNMKFETVAGTDPATQQQSAQSESNRPTSVSGAIVGGLFNKMKERREQKKTEAGGSPNRSELFTSTVELTRATSSASADDVAIPSGFKQR